MPFFRSNAAFIRIKIPVGIRLQVNTRCSGPRGSSRSVGRGGKPRGRSNAGETDTSPSGDTGPGTGGIKRKAGGRAGVGEAAEGRGNKGEARAPRGRSGILETSGTTCDLKFDTSINKAACAAVNPSGATEVAEVCWWGLVHVPLMHRRLRFSRWKSVNYSEPKCNRSILLEAFYYYGRKRCGGPPPVMPGACGGCSWAALFGSAAGAMRVRRFPAVGLSASWRGKLLIPTLEAVR